MPDKRSKEISEKYAEISGILSSEKSGGELVEVPRDFYTELRELVNDLEALLNQERERGNNKRAARLQDMLDNIRKHSEKFYRFRVRKIFRLAHNRGEKGGFRKRGLAIEEIEMLEGFVRVLERYAYLANFSRSEKELLQEIQQSMAAEEKKEDKEEIKEELEATEKESAVREPEETVPAPEEPVGVAAEEAEEIAHEEEGVIAEGDTEKGRPESGIMDLPMTEKAKFDGELPENTALVRVLYDLPEIAGASTDYRMRREDVVVLPEVIAKVLLKSGKVELISYNL